MSDDTSPYREAEPGPALTGVVRRLWRYEASGDAGRIERIPADLIVHLGAPYREIGPDRSEREQPPVLFAGQLTKPLAIVATGRVATLGIRFEPDGARRFFGAPMDPATDARLDFGAIDPGAASLRAELLRAKDWSARFALAENYVAQRIRTLAIPRDDIVAGAVCAMTRGDAADAAALSERQFQRRFKTEVGVSPRMFQSILRFRRVFDEIEHGAPDWITAALAAGYFDQPQMARDFRRFLGCTATEWAREKAGLSAALAAESYKPRSGRPG